MKCKCGLEMELWQTTRYNGGVIKRYRCACGREKAELPEAQPQVPREPKKKESK